MNVKNMLPNIKDSVIKVFSYEKVIVENYHCLEVLSNEIIKLKKYEIEGNNLFVKRMDGYLIEIEGNIKKITFV